MQVRPVRVDDKHLVGAVARGRARGDEGYSGTVGRDDGERVALEGRIVEPRVVRHLAKSRAVAVHREDARPVIARRACQKKLSTALESNRARQSCNGRTVQVRAVAVVRDMKVVRAIDVVDLVEV